MENATHLSLNRTALLLGSVFQCHRCRLGSSLGKFSSQRSVRKISFELKTRIADKKYECELKAAVDIVERASQLCLNVQNSFKKKDGGVPFGGRVEKQDATPVTVADYGIQALVSLELDRLFPSIPLLAEEDAAQLREDLNSNTSGGTSLVQLVLKEVENVLSQDVDMPSSEQILEAIDRGGRRSFFGRKSTYWVLDPVDGTRGFLRCGDALYVVGLALIVDGDLVLGVMGCPNVGYKVNVEAKPGQTKLQMVTSYNSKLANVQFGLLMAASLGCGCWVKPLKRRSGKFEKEWSAESLLGGMIESKVCPGSRLKEATFCISDHEDWKLLPIAGALDSAADPEDRVPENEANCLPLCCGSLCKYFATALGSASIFMLHVDEGRSVKIWDHAAGVICVTEAGGQVTDLEGNGLQELIGEGQALLKPRGGGLVAANSRLRERVVACFHVKKG